MPNQPNILFLFADQLRAASLPVYGERQIHTPHIDRLAGEGTRFSNAISSCPVCTPYRAMLVTGRHPQTTGHIFNHMCTRHDEISVADAFGHAGYRTGWVGKWHLHTAGYGNGLGPDYVPEGRDRLGFDYWRGYNYHHTYFNGFVAAEDWNLEPWDGYETRGLQRYMREFVAARGNAPFCLFVSPHQPHWTSETFAPEEYYARLPERLALPANVPDHCRKEAAGMYRHYLAMTLALDDMVGDVMDFLEESGLADNTILIFTSDHGSQVGAQGIGPWEKMQPYEESLRVPMLARFPGRPGGRVCDALVSPVDLFPTLCGLSGVPVPRTVEGHDLSGACLGTDGAFAQEAVFTMNFVHDWPGRLENGNEWRGVRTRRHSYARWLDGRTVLYDLEADPLQRKNLAGDPAATALQDDMEKTLRRMMKERNDAFRPCVEYADWFDSQRRVVRNAHGPLGNPEAQPDWGLLQP